MSNMHEKNGAVIWSFTTSLVQRMKYLLYLSAIFPLLFAIYYLRSLKGLLPSELILALFVLLSLSVYLLVPLISAVECRETGVIFSTVFGTRWPEVSWSTLKAIYYAGPFTPMVLNVEDDRSEEYALDLLPRKERNELFRLIWERTGIPVPGQAVDGNVLFSCALSINQKMLGIYYGVLFYALYVLAHRISFPDDSGSPFYIFVLMSLARAYFCSPMVFGFECRNSGITFKTLGGDNWPELGWDRIDSLSKGRVVDENGARYYLEFVPKKARRQLAVLVKERSHAEIRGFKDLNADGIPTD